MKIKLTRAFSDRKVTMGILQIEGIEHKPIYTLENPDRITLHDCRIPAGTYKCEPYSGTKYKNVYILKNVPGRTAILIHWGNTEKDTLGCILVGMEAGHLGEYAAVKHSRVGFDYLRSLIGDNDFELEIV